MTNVQSIERFAQSRGVDVVHCRQGQRRDEVTQEYLERFEGTEGVLFIGNRMIGSELEIIPEVSLLSCPWRVP